MNVKLILTVFSQFSILSVFCVRQDPDQFRDAVEIIRSRGFVAQEHLVKTADGYILTLHRIINPYIPRNKTKKSLLLVHGILASSTDWLMNRPGYLKPNGDYIEDRYSVPVSYRQLNGKKVPIGGSTAFVLSQFGYDVWLGNTRGTTYSQNHIQYNYKKDPRYWMFSIDQIALCDIPTMIYHILKTTRRESVGYICHSQGCTAMFAFLSAKPVFSKIVSDFIALSPVVFATNTAVILPLRPLSPLNSLFRSVPLGILLAFGPQLQLQGILCNDKSLRYVCGVLLGIATGLNIKGTAYDRISSYAAHFPSGVSTWVLAHFAQISGSGRFAKFDYGISQNLIEYGKPFPPEYPLNRIRLKRISIFYSMNDQVANFKDVQKIKQYLTVRLYSENVMEDHKWGHYDYFSHKNVGFYLNSKIIDLLY